MKKALIIATTAYMIEQFEWSNIHLLQQMGYQVDVAVNFSESINPMSQEAIEHFKARLDNAGVNYYQISFLNKPLSILRHIKAYKELKTLMKKEKYDICHCHTPFAGVIGRIAAYRSNISKLVYTAHGFHFFKGSPVINWLIYYPIEKVLSKLTDVLIVINQDDYRLAHNRFKMKHLYKVNGVGVSIDEVTSRLSERQQLRKTYGIRDSDLVLLSVGELNNNKNHEVMIRALSEMTMPDVKYYLIGTGTHRVYLEQLVEKYSLSNTVFFLGYVPDVSDILPIGDVFCFPSKREGLGLAAIEAMACGMPLLTSNAGGINDYSINGLTGFKYSPNDVKGFRDGILKLRDVNLRNSIGLVNKERAKNYDKKHIVQKMKKIYESMS